MRAQSRESAPGFRCQAPTLGAHRVLLARHLPLVGRRRPRRLRADPIRAAKEDAAAARERETLARQPNEIGARHILVMHSGSKDKPDNLKRTREEARARAQEALLKIRGGASFKEVVAQYSDEPGGSPAELGRRRLLAEITEPTAIVALLEHLGLPARAPPIAAARAPGGSSCAARERDSVRAR